MQYNLWKLFSYNKYTFILLVSFFIQKFNFLLIVELWKQHFYVWSDEKKQRVIINLVSMHTIFFSLCAVFAVDEVERRLIYFAWLFVNSLFAFRFLETLLFAWGSNNNYLNKSDVAVQSIQSVVVKGSNMNISLCVYNDFLKRKMHYICVALTGNVAPSPLSDVLHVFWAKAEIPQNGIFTCMKKLYRIEVGWHLASVPLLKPSICNQFFFSSLHWAILLCLCG